MKKLSISLALLAGLPLAAAADVTKEDIKKLSQAGISDDVIIAFIRANGPVKTLSSDDVVELKAAGASDKVLGAILNPQPPKVEQAPPRREEPSVVIPQQNETRVVEKTVYVNSYPTYPRYVYYDDCDSYYPRYTYYSSCSPSYYSYYPRSCATYYRPSRRSGWSVGWCW